MNSVTDYIDSIVAFFAFSMYYCSFLYVLTHVTTHITVCVIYHAEIKLTYLNSLMTYAVYYYAIFTARCTLVQSAVLRSHVVCPSVCPSVCNVGEL